MKNFDDILTKIQNMKVKMRRPWQETKYFAFEVPKNKKKEMDKFLRNKIIGKDKDKVFGWVTPGIFAINPNFLDNWIRRKVEELGGKPYPTK